MNESIYYNGSKMLSYNCLFNFIISNRGAGKTFFAKDFVIRDFLKDKSQFIYLRRYDTELKGGKKEKFFDDIASKYEGTSFKINGDVAKINDADAGFFVALSKAKIQKSVPFPNVKTIIFDEFLLDKKSHYHYLYDEVVNFLEFYETVARSRDNVRVLFLSNAMSVTNPYFLYFNIKPNGKRFQRVKKDILLEMFANNEFKEMKRKTRFGQLIAGSKYEKYAIDNEFLRDNNSFIGKKTAKAKNQFIMKYNGVKYGVWIDYDMGKYYVSYNIDPSCLLTYSITLDDHTENTMLLKGRKSVILTQFTQNYQLGNVIFENMNIKNACYDIIRLFLL